MRGMQAVAEKPGRLVLHPGWVAFAALALAVPVGALLFRQSIAPDLPMLGELPAFSLVAEDGKPFGRDDLLGRGWLVDRMGRIRGYYDADDRDRLLRDARAPTAGGRG